MSLAEQIARATGWLANGYKPVPCLKHDAPKFITRNGEEEKNSPGKRPHSDLWHNKDAEVYGATEESIKKWRNARNINDYPNLGIACGWTVAADCDVYEPTLAAEAEQLIIEHLGATPLRRVGLPPKVLLLYRAATAPLTKAMTALFVNDAKQTAQIEIMGQGQQVVAHGLHPDNGQPYTWGEQSPDDTPLAELPAVTAEQVALLIADAEALFLEHGYRRKAEPEQPAAAGDGPTRPATGGPFDAMSVANVNNAAMAAFAAWVPNLFGKAARKTRTGYRVSSAALGRGLEEDISITPKGIVDFGEHDMGDARRGKRTPVELVSWHRCWPIGEATRWLAELVNVELPGHPGLNGDARPGASKAKAKPLPFKMLDELKLSTAPFWLIDGYLVRSPMMMIYGPAGSGKTYLGVSVAIGMLLAQWFGRAAELGAVLICAFERHDDFRGSAGRLARPPRHGRKKAAPRPGRYGWAGPGRRRRGQDHRHGHGRRRAIRTTHAGDPDRYHGGSVRRTRTDARPGRRAAGCRQSDRRGHRRTRLLGAARGQDEP